MIFDINYFIEKFEAIPKEFWSIKGCVDSLGKRDALGHCGCDTHNITPEGEALMDILSDHEPNPFRCVFICAMINDGEGFASKYGNNPQERTVNRLKELRLKYQILQRAA